MTKSIEFIPKTKEAEILVDKPQPASKFIPDWYKKADRYVGGEKKLNYDTGQFDNLGMKGCIPFLDGFTTGYIQTTWNEIYIESQDGEVRYSHSSKPVALGTRDLPSQIPIPDEFHNIEFLWKMQWLAKVPRRYSIIYTHPFNRVDLPFHTLTGVVDADRLHYEDSANHPFFLKKNFSGIIPVGTPIVMIIPFKREDWSSRYLEYNEKNNCSNIFQENILKGITKNICGQKRILSRGVVL